MSKDAKKVIVSVTNDLVGDHRVHKVSASLSKMGFDVLLVGRKLKRSIPVVRAYKTKRLNLLFKKSAFFYAEYNFRLFLILLFRKVDVYLSNDLDTLPANYLASLIRKKELVFDSHEYFTEVPELVNRPKVKRIWEKIEKRILPKIEHTYTVCRSIADVYNKKYGVNMKVIRNIPEYDPYTENEVPEIEKMFSGIRIILYQGSVNIGRGLEEVIDAMNYIENAVFLIIGDGDIKKTLEEKVIESNLKDKVHFAGKIPFSGLKAYTKYAHIGISLEKNIGLNYYYALPNKLFDYIHAGVPVLTSRLPEIERIVDEYGIGIFIENHEPEHIAERIRFMLNSNDDYSLFKNNTKKAAVELCWENEEKVLKDIFKQFID